MGEVAAALMLIEMPALRRGEAGCSGFEAPGRKPATRSVRCAAPVSVPGRRCVEPVEAVKIAGRDASPCGTQICRMAMREVACRDFNEDATVRFETAARAQE
jgi:hypothetical protein